MTRFIVDIPDQLKRDFKAYCSANGKYMKQELQFMIDDYLRNVGYRSKRKRGGRAPFKKRGGKK